MTSPLEGDWINEQKMAKLSIVVRGQMGPNVLLDGMLTTLDGQNPPKSQHIGGVADAATQTAFTIGGTLTGAPNVLVWTGVYKQATGTLETTWVLAQGSASTVVSGTDSWTRLKTLQPSGATGVRPAYLANAGPQIATRA